MLSHYLFQVNKNKTGETQNFKIRNSNEINQRKAKLHGEIQTNKRTKKTVY